MSSNRFVKRDILEYLQCMINTETATPLDIVNRMLDLIPPEVFQNDNARFLCPCCKDGIFLREIVTRILKYKYLQLGDDEFKKHQRELLLNILNNQIFGIAISYRGYEVTRRTLYTNKLMGLVKNNIYFNEDLGDFVKDKDGINTEKQCFHFIQNQEEISNFFKSKGINTMQFDVCIGNPPYQIKTGDKTHQLYLQFFKQSFSCSKQSIMIFPSGWLKASGKGSGMVLAPEMRQNKNIVSVDVYFEDANKNDYIIFNSVGTGGVNIVNWKKDYNNNGLVDYYEYGVFKCKKDLKEIKSRDSIDLNILNKTKAEEYFDSLVSGWNPFGIGSPLLAHSEKYNFTQYIKNEINDNTIEILDGNWGNKKWYIIDKNIDYVEPFSNKRIKIKLNNKDKWKVCYGKMGANTIYRQLFIIEPNKICSDSFLCVFTDTKQQAKNIITYLKTYFVRYLIKLNQITYSAYRNVFASVPNIGDRLNPRTNKIGWDSDWNDNDLQNIFNLTNEEMEYVKQQAIKSDNGRGGDDE